VVVLIHHHGDQAILSSGSIKLQTGTDVEVSVVPQITVTTDEAVDQFDPEKQGCFTCDEVIGTLAFNQPKLPEHKSPGKGRSALPTVKWHKKFWNLSDP
jgi:hypothetical protein